MTIANPALSTPRRGRVLVGQVIVKLAVFAAYAGMISVVLPGRIEDLDPGGKVATLAMVTSIGFVVTALAQPIVGALSDRTRSRFGRRLPWMAAGALIGGLAIGTVGDASSVLLIGMLWAVSQLALHGLEVAMDAYLVDAFPPERRGRAAGVVGFALVAGTAVGAVVSGLFVTRPALASWLFAVAILVAVVVFAALVRDQPAFREYRPRRRLGQTVRIVAAALAAHPDFTRILVWRVGYSIAYSAVFAYLLYIVTDLVGLPDDEAAQLVAIATVLGSAAAAVTVVVGGWLSDLVGRRRPFLLIGNAALIAGDVLLLTWPTAATVLVAATVFGVGLGLSISCGRALASQVLPDPEGGAATGLGTLSTAANLGQALAPVVAAFAIGLAGYPGAFVASILGAIAGSIAIALVKTVR